MTVIEEKEDQFPIGMRVLAVDDDPTCLLLLETLLRRCNYKVTTTSQAITALKLLRENKDKFDLVISDVHMPDMDGFKLLEHVGLEMDIPVIMLSAYSDPELVMKGITHGACNYLLKPVRIEELKNIWQHVIRKRCDNKDRNNDGSGDRVDHGNHEGTLDLKLNKKRKDQKQDEEEVADENGHENQDPMTQKKPRVVWSVDLHGKFVAAVNQLGIDNAVPKKILALMNVDKLTRENVASHLQKYKLYLRKYSALANERASMVTSMNKLGIQHLAGPAHLCDTTLRPLPNVGMFGRLNSPAVLGMQNLPSPGVVHFGQIQAQGHLYNSQSYSKPNILQGMPISVELNGSLHQEATRTGETPNIPSIATGFPASTAFAEENMFVGSSDSPFNGVSNRPVMVEKCHQGILLDPENRKESPSMTSTFSPDFVDYGRCSDGWSGSVSSMGDPSNSFALSDYFGEDPLHPSDARETMSTMSLQKRNDPCDFSPVAAMPIHVQDLKAGPIGGNVSRTIDYAQGLYGQKMDSIFHLNCVHQSAGDSGTPINQNEIPMVQSSSPNQLMFQWTGSFNSTRESNNPGSNSSGAMLGRPNEGLTISQQRTQGTYDFNNTNSLEDLATAMMKQDQVKAKFGEDTCGYQASSYMN